MTDKKLKDITSEKLVEIYGKVFNQDYNVPNYYLEVDPELKKLDLFHRTIQGNLIQICTRRDKKIYYI